VQVLESHLPESSEDHRVTAAILARIGTLARTLDELVVFARTNAPRLACCSLLEVARRAADLVLADPEAAELHVRVGGQDVHVEADAALLAAALRNLLANAAQAMHGRGLIVIEASSDEAGARLLIEDEGPGMAPDVLARAFDPFFTTRRGGTGLGLAIVRRVIEMHGGTITLTSRPGRGVVALVTLPAPGGRR
jgi:signal transduction histidine kinase